MSERKTIVIPTYNEKNNISILIEKILTLYPDFHIIVVDDNSPDGTGAVINELTIKNSRVQAIHRPCKAGLGTAYVEGFKLALANGADLIFEMDADFSHDPECLKDFINASKKADLVIGSRYQNGIRVSGWRFRRLILSKLANIYISYVLVKPLWDFTAGYRCYRRKVLETIDLKQIKSDGYAFQIEMAYLCFKHGFRVIEIPIVFKEREHGYSKISRNVIFEAFWLTLRCRAPIFEILKHLKYLFKDYSDFVKKYPVNNSRREAGKVVKSPDS